jgi:hypothetical protein
MRPRKAGLFVGVGMPIKASMGPSVRVVGRDQPHPAVRPEAVIDFALAPDHWQPLAPTRDAGVGRLAEQPPQLITCRTQSGRRLRHRCVLRSLRTPQLSGH